MAMFSKQIRTYGSAAGLVAAGLVAGGVLATSMSAAAADGTPSPRPSANAANPNPGDPSKPQRSDETLLTGDTLAKVKAAVLKKYPGASFDRVETDSDGVYEAHITKADGARTTVELDKNYAITGEEQGPVGRPGRGHGCPPPPGASRTG
ncbi:MAG: PepSY domain-containing protein [Mycobacteriales bacterium]